MGFEDHVVEMFQKSEILKDFFQNKVHYWVFEFLNIFYEFFKSSMASQQDVAQCEK